MATIVVIVMVGMNSKLYGRVLYGNLWVQSHSLRQRDREIQIYRLFAYNPCNARIKNVGKSKSCMDNNIPIICKQTVESERG